MQPDNCSRRRLPPVRVRVELGLVLGLGAIFLGGNCPRTHRITWHFFDISIVQGWILYKRDAGNNPLSLKMFKVSVAMSLIKEGKSTRTSRGRRSASVERAFIAKSKRVPAVQIPNTSIRTDCYDHLPSFTEKGRC